MSAYITSKLCNANFASKSRRGFSAVELVAVSTIIAILSLILVQSLQNRVEEAREARVMSDLGELRDVQMLIFAESSRYARLQDLDKTLAYTSDTTLASLDIEIPGLFYEGRVADVTTDDLLVLNPPDAVYDQIRATMARKWHGPYMNFTKYITMSTLVAENSPLLSTNGGPIYYDDSGTIQDVAEDRYPLDPWGNPYIFVPRYHVDTTGPDVVIGARVFSMGPDGFPGSNTGTGGDTLEGEDYFPADVRADGDLGDSGSDDYVFEF